MSTTNSRLPYLLEESLLLLLFGSLAAFFIGALVLVYKLIAADAISSSARLFHREMWNVDSVADDKAVRTFFDGNPRESSDGKKMVLDHEVDRDCDYAHALSVELDPSLARTFAASCAPSSSTFVLERRRLEDADGTLAGDYFEY